MRAKAIVFALSACAAFGQDTARVFHLHHIDQTQDLNEFTTLVRTISDIPQVSADAAQKTLSVRGTASQVAIAEFLFTELDRQTVPDSVTQEFRVSNNADDVVRIFFAPYTATVQQFQEIATTVRTIAEIRRVFTYNTPRALIVRGTADQIALTSWMVNELGKPVTAGTASTTYQYASNDRNGENLVRVFYVKDTPTVAVFQQLATQIRTTTHMRRVFTYNESRALALRGNEAQLATAEQMLQDRQIASK